MLGPQAAGKVQLTLVGWLRTVFTQFNLMLKCAQINA